MTVRQINRINPNSLIVNTAVFMYFFSIIIVNQVSGVVASLIWYVTVFFGVFTAFLSCTKLNKSVVVFAILMMASGICNFMFAGTTGVRELALLICLFILSWLLLSDYADDRVLLAALLLNIIVIVSRFLTVGLYGKLFISSSTNYVSVFLMYPALVYYTLREKKNKSIPIWPVALVFILSLLSRGRGGIISSAVFFAGVFLAKYHNTTSKGKLYFFFILFVVFIVAISNIGWIVERVKSSVVTEYFRARGLRSSRIQIWGDYLEQASSDWKSFLFGPVMSKTMAGTVFSGNTHNSFLNIHRNNGIVMLILILFLLGKNALISIKKREYVYLTCLTAAVVRAFTDNVFWLTYGSAVFFFLLFFQEFEEINSLTEKRPIVSSRTVFRGDK